MNLVELDQALRKLRLSGMTDVLEPPCSRPRPSRWHRSTCSAALVSDELQIVGLGNRRRVHSTKSTGFA